MVHAVKRNSETWLRLESKGTEFYEKICDMLERSRFFSDLARDEVEKIGRWMNLYEAKKGTIIFSEGDKNSGLCLLVSGEIAILKRIAPYKNKRIATVTAGRCIGEMSIVDGQPLSATAVAFEESRVLLMSKENFFKLVEHDPTLGAKLLLKIASMISMRLRRTTGQLIDFIEADAVEK